MRGLLILVSVLLMSAQALAEEALPLEPPDLYAGKHTREFVDRVEPKLKADFQKAGLVYGSPIFVRIFKESRELELWVQASDGRFRKFRTYQVCKMSGVVGPKLEKGDDQAPEGFYTVNADWMHPKSDYHLAFNIGYPNAYDRAHEYTGKAIMVHGKCASSGCFAMTNEKIDEIYSIAAAALTNGQGFFHVHIFPFRLTDANLRRYPASPWKGFWQNLKEGYDLFEKNGVPPNDYVLNKRYYFEETTQLCEVKTCTAKDPKKQCEAPALLAASE